MAQIEPMDVDSLDGDFDNKENTFQHNNVLSRTPCTEKGYEELDVSELNMKLRYSITPASSPMSKSFSGPCLDNKTCNLSDDLNNTTGSENGNLTRSFNSTLTKVEKSMKSKVLPLQTLSADTFVDSNRNSFICGLSDATEDKNVKISVNINDIDENLSLPSTSSSVANTPDATTPTKEMPKPEGSPILRGLKSVLSMFRPSHSPISSADDNIPKQDALGPIETQLSHNNESDMHTILPSTPVAVNRQKGQTNSRRSSPLKESVVFNDGLERELQWKDKKECIYKQDKIPVHKLTVQNQPEQEVTKKTVLQHFNTSVEYMDISCTDSEASKAVSQIEANIHVNNNEGEITIESDNEFLDCETTFSKNESCTSNCEVLDMENRKQIINNFSTDVKDYAMTLGTKESECKIVMKSSGNVKSGDNSFAAKLGQNSSNIIKASDNTTQSQCNNINLNDEYIKAENENAGLFDAPQVTSHNVSENLNVTRSTEDKIICNDDKVKVSKIIVDYNVSSHKNSDSPRYDDIGKIENLSDLSTSINIDNYKNIFSVYNNENIEAIVTKNEIENIKDANKNTTFGNVIKLQNVHMDLLTLSNNKEPIVLKNLADMHGKNTDLKTHDAIPVFADSAICVDNIITENRDKNHKSEENLPSTGYTVNEDVKLSNVYFDSDSTVQLNLNPDGNITNTDFDPNQPESISTQSHETNHNIIESNLDINKQKYSLTLNVIENECQTDLTQTLDILSDTVIKTSGVGEKPELIVQNNVEIRESPSQIPLPDDDKEKADTECNDLILYKQACTLQDVADYMCGKNLVIGVDGTQCTFENFTDTQNVTGEHEENTSKLILQNIILNDDVDTIVNMDDHDISQSDLELKSKMLKCEVNVMCTENIVHSESDTMSVTVPDNIQNKEINNIDVFENPSTAKNYEKEGERDYIEVKNKDITSEIIISTEVVNESVNNVNLNKVTDGIRNISKEVQINADIIEKSSEEVPVIFEEDSQVDRNLLEINKSDCFNSLEELEDNKNKNIDLSTNDSVMGLDGIEEIITSANNSPYVSVSDLIIDSNPNCLVEEIDNPVFTVTREVSPTSPKIHSKGYNFNFEEIDNPFATKTKIRTSPTPDSCYQSSAVFEKEIRNPEDGPKKVINRPKPQNKRKRPAQKKISNSTFTSKQNISDTIPQKSDITAPSADIIKSLDPKPLEDVEAAVNQSMENNISEGSNDKVDLKTQSLKNTLFSIQNEVIPKEEEITCHMVSNERCTSSPEQYFSLGTSSCESAGLMNKSKNVFNLPEIDDMNFNPFATKSRIGMSPPHIPENIVIQTEGTSNSSLTLERNGDTDIIIKDTGTDYPNINKIGTEDYSSNISNTTTNSSNGKDATVREILTEDEDTIEGPFLECDELKDTDKFTDVDVESGVMNFDEILPQEKDVNIENGELFIDADALEFLLNQNKSTTVLDSGKESLFLKFDPLFAKRVSSDSVLAALSNVQKRQSTPKKITKLQNNSIHNEKPIAGTSINKDKDVLSEDVTEDPSAISKPMMVVNPAVSSIVSPRKSLSPPKVNRRSLTFTSPAMAVIDRLLSLSGNSSHLNHDTSIPFLSGDYPETDLTITHLRELLAEKEIHVHNLRSESKELKDRLNSLEIQVRSLETISTERLTKINELTERLSEKTKINKSMAIVVEEYERTIASLIAETEHDKKRNAEERIRLIKERDEQTAHLTSMEVSFNDLHSKYEKSKQIILNCKANEDIYKKSIEKFEENISKLQNNYELLKQHATSKLNHANHELEKMNRAHDAEVLKLNAMIKRKDLHITTLQETLTQKTKANEELTAICDELINKVG